jgi:hypothetical protein
MHCTPLQCHPFLSRIIVRQAPHALRSRLSTHSPAITAVTLPTPLPAPSPRPPCRNPVQEGVVFGSDKHSPTKLSFRRWLYRWLRQMIDKSQGRLHDAFESVSGVWLRCCGVHALACTSATGAATRQACVASWQRSML